jgi:chromosome segregation ATPase
MWSEGAVMWIRKGNLLDLRDRVALNQGEIDSLRQRLAGTAGALTAQHERAAGAIAEAATLKEQNRVLQTHLDWLRVRVNQIEAERARLIEKALQIKVAVPTISSPLHPPDRTAAPKLEQLAALFEDVGDEAARELGIEHDADGGVLYRK